MDYVIIQRLLGVSFTKTYQEFSIASSHSKLFVYNLYTFEEAFTDHLTGIDDNGLILCSALETCKQFPTPQSTDKSCMTTRY